MDKIAVVIGLFIIVLGASYFLGVPVMDIVNGMIDMVQFAINCFI